MVDLGGLKGRIVVGCDGSTQAADAAGWAAQRAVERGQGLTLMVATGRPGDIEPGLLLAAGISEQLIQRRQTHVAAMTQELRDRNPGLDVEVAAVPESPGQALVDATEYADPLVIGTRGLGRVSGHILGAMAEQVVAHARGTLVVVPGRVWHMPGQQQGDIVVGYDFSPQASAAMDFAFAEGQARGVPVRVLQVLELGELWDLKPLDILGSRDPLAAHEVRLDAAVEPWRERFPDVTVKTLVRQGATASALLADESAEASLVVVGNRGLGGFVGLLLGSTARRLLHHVRCPAAVVR